MSYVVTHNEAFLTNEGEELVSVATILTSGGSRFQIAPFSGSYYLFVQDGETYRRHLGIFDAAHEVLKTLPPPSKVRTRRPSSSKSIFRPDAW